MKRLVILILLLIPYALFADQISFTGGSSYVSLQEGERSVRLSGGARVQVDSLTIQADTITLEGDDYEDISCTGSITITDEERGLEIRTSMLHYDRLAERLLISSWCEISDRENEMVASAAALTYDMGAEILELSMRVNLVKNTSSGMLQATSESVVYDRGQGTLVLSGGSTVNWNSDSYSAGVITIDTERERINLSGQIGGTIHG